MQTKSEFIRHLMVFMLVAAFLNCKAQERPKLVAGITVDKMRWDYLYRFQSRFLEKDGFRRMMQGGFGCENTYIPYSPNCTACGHAGIYKNSVPAVLGTTGDNWYIYNIDFAPTLAALLKIQEPNGLLGNEISEFLK